jgi:hypothetical protein
MLLLRKVATGLPLFHDYTEDKGAIVTTATTDMVMTIAPLSSTASAHSYFQYFGIPPADHPPSPPGPDGEYLPRR